MDAGGLSTEALKVGPRGLLPLFLRVTLFLWELGQWPL
jgi:hypothetical protein